MNLLIDFLCTSQTFGREHVLTHKFHFLVGFFVMDTGHGAGREEVMIHLWLPETTGIYWGNQNKHWVQITKITGPREVINK